MLDRYEIRDGRDAPCELWGISRCGVVEYMICEGTHTYCADVRAKLEGME